MAPTSSAQSYQDENALACGRHKSRVTDADALASSRGRIPTACLAAIHNQNRRRQTINSVKSDLTCVQRTTFFVFSLLNRQSVHRTIEAAQIKCVLRAKVIAHKRYGPDETIPKSADTTFRSFPQPRVQNELSSRTWYVPKC